MSTMRRYTYTRTDLVKAAASAEERGKQDSTRHKCFISYHIADAPAVVNFLDTFGSVIIPRVVGVTDEDPLINSDDRDYIMRRIREKYLTDSTVTIVIGGQCTWARKYVDWEVASSLRNDSVNKRSGLLAYTPKGSTTLHLPARVKDNWVKDDRAKSYAEFWVYPSTQADVRGQVEAAFQARTYKGGLVDNRRELRRNNAACP